MRVPEKESIGINITALVIGLLAGFLVTVSFKRLKFSKHQFAYSLLLATFSVYFWLFSVYSNDYEVLVTEFIIGLSYIAIAWLGYIFKRPSALVILSLGFIGHVLYDVLHLTYSARPVAQNWWPEFCGAVDIVIGGYILWLATITQSDD